MEQNKWQFLGQTLYNQFDPNLPVIFLDYKVQNPMARANLMGASRLQSKCSVPPKMLRLQQKFQEKNNVPVHLKGGATDKILYLTTVGLAGCGLFYTLAFFAGYIID